MEHDPTSRPSSPPPRHQCPAPDVRASLPTGDSHLWMLRKGGSSYEGQAAAAGASHSRLAGDEAVLQAREWEDGLKGLESCC